MFRSGLGVAALRRDALPAWGGAVANLGPRRLLEEPYRYVRKPLYPTDFA